MVRTPTCSAKWSTVNPGPAHTWKKRVKSVKMTNGTISFDCHSHRTCLEESVTNSSFRLCFGWTVCYITGGSAACHTLHTSALSEVTVRGASLFSQYTVFHYAPVSNILDKRPLNIHKLHTAIAQELQASRIWSWSYAEGCQCSHCHTHSHTRADYGKNANKQNKMVYWARATQTLVAL